MPPSVADSKLYESRARGKQMHPIPSEKSNGETSIGSFLHRDATAFGKSVCRLGLASHEGSQLTVGDIESALDRGVNFLNWAGSTDQFSEAIASLGSRRGEVVVCVQVAARSAADAAEELRGLLAALHTDYVDLLTFYYVEAAEEWDVITAANGALGYCRQAQRDGRVRRLGVTTHRRPLAAAMAQSGLLDLLMLRYNAAHRGAETEVFPTTDALGMPIIAYTALRWGGLLRTTPDDPPGFVVPSAAWWYRFVLQSPSVTMTMAAPHSRAELDEALTVLDAMRPMHAVDYARLAAHGQRVRRHAGQFP
jgi:predicted aldo/keto reductase-like oxidoreductase